MCRHRTLDSSKVLNHSSKTEIYLWMSMKVRERWLSQCPYCTGVTKVLVNTLHLFLCSSDIYCHDHYIIVSVLRFWCLHTTDLISPWPRGQENWYSFRRIQLVFPAVFVGRYVFIMCYCGYRCKVFLSGGWCGVWFTVKTYDDIQRCVWEREGCVVILQISVFCTGFVR